VYAIETGFIVHFIVKTSRQREGTEAYNVNILLVVALFGLICLAFLVYGVGLLVATRKAMNTKGKLRFYAQLGCFCADVNTNSSAGSELRYTLRSVPLSPDHKRIPESLAIHISGVLWA